jgi:hypothetical protein
MSLATWLGLAHFGGLFWPTLWEVEEELDILVAHIADLWIRGVDQERGFGKRPGQVSRRALHLAPIEPLGIVLRPENGRLRR